MKDILPQGYSLLMGETYTRKVDESDPNLDDYYSSHEEPEEAEDSPFVVGLTVWYDLKENKVKRYVGRQSVGNAFASCPTWKEDSTINKYVTDSETGELLGKIVEPVRTRRVTSVQVEHISFKDLLDNLDKE